MFNSFKDMFKSFGHIFKYLMICLNMREMVKWLAIVETINK